MHPDTPARREPLSSQPTRDRPAVSRSGVTPGPPAGTVHSSPAHILSRGRLLLLAALLSVGTCVRGHAQAREGIMSEREVDTLRDTAFVPSDRLLAYTNILNTREKEIEDLVAKPHHVTYGRDLHDFIEQFAAIVDELNDNLDDYRDKHRDIRKALPKLIQSTERWATALRAPEDKQDYKIVRRLALDALKDTRDLAESLQTSQADYFKAHPEAAKAEKDRAANPHAPNTDGPP